MDAHPAERGIITDLFARVAGGDQVAAIELWPWIDRAARGPYRGLADGLDLDAAINDAYARVLRLAPLGRLDGVANREQLRRFLRWVVYCNLLSQRRREASGAARSPGGPIDAGAAPDVGSAPDSAAMIRDEIRSIFTELGRRDPRLAEIARLRLDGFEDAEIAGALGVHVKTVQRKLRIIKQHIERRVRGEAPLGDGKEAA